MCVGVKGVWSVCVCVCVWVGVGCMKGVHVCSVCTCACTVCILDGECNRITSSVITMIG